jgi:hypothetical protein
MCAACHNPNGDMVHADYGWDGLACPQCDGLVPRHNNDGIAKCLDCGGITDVTQQLKEENEIKKLLKQELSLNQLISCHSQLSKCLYKYNTDLGRISSAIAYKYIIEGSFSSALVYCQQSCHILESIFGSHSIELMQEQPNYIEILLHNGEIGKAVEIARKTLSVIKKLHGDHHQDTIHLEKILNTFKLK